MPPLLSIQNLYIQFAQNTTAVDNISFHVNKGEILAIVGESGSGKSVTALSILQLLPKETAQYTGEIFFNNDGTTTNLLQQPSEALRTIRGNDIAMIFQEPMTSLNPVLTCGEQVVEAILTHKRISKKEACAKTIALFERVQLPNPAQIFTRYPHELSGGQKQRVMIAMAMSCEPSLLIADEPTTALDVTVQQTILQLIKSLQRQTNMAVIFITHDLGVVNEIADRVVVMYKGKIVEAGTTEQVLKAPKHDYTKSLLAARAVVNGERAKNDLLSTEQPLLQIKDLSVWYPAKKSFLGKALSYTKAVDGVNFDVIQGETLGLVGESGCGKTTLGRTLLRLIQPHSGLILYRGEDLLTFPKEALRTKRKDLQIVFQDPYSSLNPRLTGGEAIMEPLQVHGLYPNNRARREKVVELLEKVQLTPDHFKRYPHQFSGGQRQRIGIARALALNPGFIVFDESVSALDVSIQAQVLQLLNDLKAEYGFTAIFISHDLGVVRYISDRIMVMNKGRIEELGPAEEVFNHPQSAYTRRLVAALPTL